MSGVGNSSVGTRGVVMGGAAISTTGAPTAGESATVNRRAPHARSTS
ncbi:hypothetical protein ABTY61_17965 [Kitasatospora sp. NPDC096128]